MENKKLVTFLDSVGRTIIGELAKEDTEVIEIFNPVVVHVVPVQDGQGTRMSLQLFPLFFREFLGDKDERIAWRYSKKNIAQPTKEVTFDFKLQSQYAQLFTNYAQMQQASKPQSQPQPQKQDDNIIKLFDN